MTYPRHWFVLLASLLLVQATGLAQPGEPESPTRIHYFGNSLTDELKYDDFKKLATDQGHPLDWKREMAPGVPVFHHWSRLEKWRKKLTDEHWDVVTLQPFQNFEREYKACESFAKFLAEHQSDVQLYIYGQWPHRRTADWFRDFTFPSELAPTGKWSWTRRLYVAPGSFGLNGECKATDDGFVAEYSLRLRQLGVPRGREFPIVIGFDVAVNDDDDGDGRDSQVVWRGTARNHIHPDQYGTLVLEAPAQGQ